MATISSISWHYDGLTRDFPEIRPFTLMRAGYAGSQRYGMVAWSGDVSRSWGGFKPQAEIAMQMAMQGNVWFALLQHRPQLCRVGERFAPATGIRQRWMMQSQNSRVALVGG